MQQVIVQLRVPSGSPAGSYSFRLDVRQEAGPDEGVTKGPSVTFDVPTPKRPKRFRWWFFPFPRRRRPGAADR
jgi:hypothetical protein